MKLNKLALALGLGFAMTAGVSNAAVDQGHGTVKFKGAIIEAPCSIHPDSESREVPMGQIATAELKDGGRSTSRPFTLQLENCSLDTIKSVSTTFTGPISDIGTNALAIEGKGQGAAIIITNAGGKQIELGTPSDKQDLVIGNNDLQFAAYLQADSAKTVTPGAFTATATFALDYQ